MTDIEKARDLVYRFTTDFVSSEEFHQLMALLNESAEAREYALHYGVTFDPGETAWFDHSIRTWTEPGEFKLRVKMVGRLQGGRRFTRRYSDLVTGEQ